MDQARPSRALSTHPKDVITLSADWPTCSSLELHQATALCRSRTEASPRRMDNAKRDWL